MLKSPSSTHGTLSVAMSTAVTSTSARLRGEIPSAVSKSTQTLCTPPLMRPPTQAAAILSLNSAGIPSVCGMRPWEGEGWGGRGRGCLHNAPAPPDVASADVVRAAGKCPLKPTWKALGSAASVLQCLICVSCMRTTSVDDVRQQICLANLKDVALYVGMATQPLGGGS